VGRLQESRTKQSCRLQTDHIITRFHQIFNIHQKPLPNEQPSLRQAPSSNRPPPPHKITAPPTPRHRRRNGRQLRPLQRRLRLRRGAPLARRHPRHRNRPPTRCLGRAGCCDDAVPQRELPSRVHTGCAYWGSEGLPPACAGVGGCVCVCGRGWQGLATFARVWRTSRGEPLLKPAAFTTCKSLTKAGFGYRSSCCRSPLSIPPLSSSPHPHPHPPL